MTGLKEFNCCRGNDKDGHINCPQEKQAENLQKIANTLETIKRMWRTGEHE